MVVHLCFHLHEYLDKRHRTTVSYVTSQNNSTLSPVELPVNRCGFLVVARGFPEGILSAYFLVIII